MTKAQQPTGHFSWTPSPRWLCAGLLLFGATGGCSIEVDDPQPPASASSEPEEAGAEPAGTESKVSAAVDAGAEARSGQGGAVGYGDGDLTVLMIVDRSGSMAEAWEGGSKWQVARSALDAAIVGIETTQTMGALFFPDHSGGCAVAPLSDPSQIPFQRADGFQERWVNDTASPQGGTPLGEAFLKANVAIAEAERLGLLQKRFRVVLISDGQPTCFEDEAAIVAMADGWREKGIEVEVLGLPGSAAAATLLDAIAGKVALPGDPDVPPETTWTADSAGNGYVAPTTQDELDDSVHSIVR